MPRIMSTQANGAAAPDHPVAQDLVAQDLVVAHSSPDAIMTDADPDADPDASTPMGLRSPPDSDKAMNPDEASESELSDLDDDVADKLDQDHTFDLDLGSDPLPDPKTGQQQPEPSVSHEHEPAAAATVESTTQIKEEQEGEGKESTSHSQQPDTGAASATTPISPSEDIGEILPDRYENNVPVFKPTLKQFQDFKLFVCLSSSCAMTPGLAD